MPKSTERPHDENEGGGAFAKANAEFAQAIALLAKPAEIAPRRSRGGMFIGLLQITLTAALIVLAGMLFVQLRATRARVEALDLESFNKSSKGIVDATEQLRSFPDKIQVLGEPDKLGWLRDLPQQLNMTKAKLETELLPALEDDKGALKRLHAVVEQLKSTNEKELKTASDNVGAFVKLLEDANSTEAAAANRLISTVQDVRDMLTHIQYLTKGDSRKVRLALASRQLSVPYDLLPPPSLWTAFKGSHQYWDVDDGVIVHGKFRSQKSFGTVGERELVEMDKFQPEAGFRYVLLIDIDTPVPKVTEARPQVDVLIIVGKDTLAADNLNKYWGWSEFCRKSHGEATLMPCDLEKDAEGREVMRGESKSAIQRAVLRAASPQWPLLGVPPTKVAPAPAPAQETSKSQ